jgi:hypothetical protein
VLDSCSHEQQVACLERVSLSVVKEDASAPNDDVHLVLGVWGLFVRGHGQCEFHIACAALEDERRTFARWTRNGSLDLF